MPPCSVSSTTEAMAGAAGGRLPARQQVGERKVRHAMPTCGEAHLW